ncbi:fatty acid-binding protein 5 isoform X2 [Mastomys coucha]|uniref:fatty acid-binding protein 5 isoform X2 n=1 Tax=Mastomys coucha TaxID=35658 RepID=UPI001261F16F|nr:fatty acid-binding protein 5 isoform X2 [Mastomys coucha]
MASLKDLEGKWRLLESHGFEEYMKELDGLHLHRWRPGPAPEVGREGKYDNQETQGWQVGCGVCHEQCHLHAGL